MGSSKPADDGETRYFERRAGKRVSTWQIERSGVRYLVAWSSDAAKTATGLTVTRESGTDCRREVERKIHQKLRAGFIEVAPPSHARKPARPGRGKPVLAAFSKRSDRPVRKLPGLDHSYDLSEGLGFFEYLLVGPDESLGLWFVVKEKSHDPKLVKRFLAFLEKHRERVFSVDVVWKAKLPRAIGPFSHAVVLSPEVAQLHQPGVATRQLFWAFPVYDCEICGDESVAIADARVNGRGCIPHSTWDRKPHLVLDFRLQKAGQKQQAKFLVYDPAKTKLSDVLSLLKKQPLNSFVELRNYRGQVARVTRGKQLELGLDDAPARALTESGIVSKLTAFLQK